MTDPIRKKQGTPLPTLPPSPEGMEKEVKHYNLDEMMIEGSATAAPKPETFGVSRLWQSQSKDPVSIMIVYDGDIQKYRQHFIAYVSHLIRHYEERGVTPNVGIATPDFQMEPVAMNAMGKGDLFNALLDLKVQERDIQSLRHSLDSVAEMLRHPKFHETQKSVLLFTNHSAPSSQTLLAESILLEGENIKLNVVWDLNHQLRLHGGETPATWEEVTADLRGALSHIRPETLEDRASRTNEFFLRLGAAQLKYPDKPLLELIHAVRKDLELSLIDKDPFTTENCILSRMGCTLDLASAVLYFDYLREIGTVEAFSQYTTYAYRNISSEEAINLLRYASMPVETLIDTLIRPEQAHRASIAPQLLRPESLTDAQKERIRGRIAAMIPLTHDKGLLSDPARGNFRDALLWRLAFDAIPEVRSLDDRFVHSYHLESEDLIFENAKILHPDLLVTAFRHAIDFGGRNFQYTSQWRQRFKQMPFLQTLKLLNWLLNEAKTKPYTIRYFFRMIDDAHAYPAFRWVSYDGNIELYSITEGMNLIRYRKFEEAFDLIVKLKTETSLGAEDPTTTAEDPERTDQYLWKRFQQAVQASTSFHERAGLITGVVDYLLMKNSPDDITGKLLAKDLVIDGILFGNDLAHLARIIGMEHPKQFYFVAYHMVRNYPEEYLHLMMAPYFLDPEARNKSTQERLQVLIPLLRFLDSRLEVYSEPSKDTEILRMWADRMTEIIANPNTEPLIRQMMLYRVQRIVQKVGCTADVDLMLGPRSNAMRLTQENSMTDEIWVESLKPIQEACEEE